MTVLTTIGLQESIRRDWPRSWLVYFDHPDGAVRAWSGIGDLAYDGETWKGVGRVGRVGNAGGSKVLGVRRVDLELRGLPADVGIYLNADIRGRSAKAWIAGMNADGTKVNGTAWPVVDGIADYQELPIGDDGSVTVRIAVNEPVFNIERALDLAFTSQWINETYGPGDVSYGDAVTVFSTALDTDDNGSSQNDRSVRQAFQLSGAGVLRHQVRFRLTSTSGGATVADYVAVGRQSATWETQSTPTEILTSAASGITVSSGSSAWTDWTDFTFLDDDVLVGILDFGSSTVVRYRNLGFTTYYKNDADTFNQKAPTGFAGTTGPWCIDRIEARSIDRITGLDLVPGLANASENWTLT